MSIFFVVSFFSYLLFSFSLSNLLLSVFAKLELIDVMLAICSSFLKYSTKLNYRYIVEAETFEQNQKHFHQMN